MRRRSEPMFAEPIVIVLAVVLLFIMTRPPDSI